MKYIDYYFVLEFQWKDGWFDGNGLLRPRISPSRELIDLHGFVDYAIIEGVILNDNRFYNLEDYTNLLNEVLESKDEYFISNEIAGLKIGRDVTVPLDYLGVYGGQNNNESWNLVVKEVLQEIPTGEILELLVKWQEFLLESLKIKQKLLL